MKKQFLRLTLLLLLSAAVAGGAWYIARPSGPGPILVELSQAPAEVPAQNLDISGVIEARQVDVAPEVGGTIARLSVAEGNPVQAGQVLAELDSQLLDAQIAEAEASLALAEAQLARVQLGPRPEEIAVAEAAVDAAQAASAAAQAAWQDAIRLRDNPQELELQIAAARSQIAILDQRIGQLTAQKDAAELSNGLWARQVDILESGKDLQITIPGLGQQSVHYDFMEGEKRQGWSAWNLAGTDLWSAWVRLNQASVSRDAARRQLADLLAQQESPQEAAIRVAQAEAAYQQALAAAATAQARLDMARAGASAEQIATARTGVSQAQAALDSLHVLRRKYTLMAPIDGLALDCPSHAGEVIQAGKTMLQLGSLDPLDLVVYVAEKDLGRVKLGQPVEVRVDSLPGQTFGGRVTWIADEAEFTPRNIQTKDERVSMVFAVKISIANPDHQLKPGMPADALLASE